jgi:hypothetical protein
MANSLSGVNTAGLTQSEINQLQSAQTQTQQQTAFQKALNQLEAEGMDAMAAQQEVQKIIDAVHG